MAIDLSKLANPPEITPELAKELVREGEQDSREIRKRIEQMWALSDESLRARTR